MNANTQPNSKRLYIPASGQNAIIISTYSTLVIIMTDNKDEQIQDQVQNQEQEQEQDQAGIVVTQNEPNESKQEKEEDQHPDGCCGSCTQAKLTLALRPS